MKISLTIFAAISSTVLLIGQTNGDVRQINGYVEMFNGEIWGPICDDDIEDFQALGQVLCRQLSGNSSAFVTYLGAEAGEGPSFGTRVLGSCSEAALNSVFTLRDIDCMGNESDILHCMIGNLMDCNTDETVCIECNVDDRIVNYFPFPPESAVPTFSQWGLIILTFCLLIFGIVTIRKYGLIPIAKNKFQQ